MMPPEMFGPQQAQGPPPEMLAQLMGGAGAGAPMQPEQEAGGGSASDILRSILDLADAYRQQEKTEQNILMMEQARTLIQKILANEEADGESLMQGKISPRALRAYAS